MTQGQKLVSEKMGTETLPLLWKPFAFLSDKAWFCLQGHLWNLRKSLRVEQEHTSRAHFLPSCDCHPLPLPCWVMGKEGGCVLMQHSFLFQGTLHRRSFTRTGLSGPLLSAGRSFKPCWGSVQALPPLACEGEQSVPQPGKIFTMP